MLDQRFLSSSGACVALTAISVSMSYLDVTRLQDLNHIQALQALDKLLKSAGCCCCRPKRLGVLKCIQRI